MDEGINIRVYDKFTNSSNLKIMSKMSTEVTKARIHVIINVSSVGYDTVEFQMLDKAIMQLVHF